MPKKPAEKVITEDDVEYGEWVDDGLQTPDGESA